MNHVSFIARLLEAGYQRRWTTHATYADGSCGAGMISLYSQSTTGHEVIVQNCGEFGFMVFERSRSAKIVAELDAEAARRERIRVECDKPVPYGS